MDSLGFDMHAGDQLMCVHASFLLPAVYNAPTQVIAASLTPFSLPDCMCIALMKMKAMCTRQCMHAAHLT